MFHWQVSYVLKLEHKIKMSRGVLPKFFLEEKYVYFKKGVLTRISLLRLVYSSSMTGTSRNMAELTIMTWGATHRRQATHKIRQKILFFWTEICLPSTYQMEVNDFIQIWNTLLQTCAPSSAKFSSTSNGFQ